MKEDSPIKEQVLNPQQNTKTPLSRLHTESEGQISAADCTNALDERICAALRAASDKKALDLVVLDLRQIASFTDFFVITSGTNVRQVKAIADEVVEQLKKQGTRAARVEGYSTAEWVLVDYGDFILHVFEDKARKFYDLERLWRDAVRVPVPSHLIDTDGSLRTES